MFAFALAIVLVALAIYLFKHFVEYGNNHGPFLYPYVGCLFEMVSNKHRFLEWSTENLQRRPTNTVRLMRPGEATYFHTANPANVEHMLKTNFHGYEKGDYLRRGLTDLLGGGIFNVDGPMWKLQRKIASFEFTTHSLRDYLMDVLEEETRLRLLPTVESFIGGNKLLDLQDVFMRFTFDTICKLSFGVDPKALSPSLPSVEFMTAFDDATVLSNMRFYDIHPVIWKFKKLLHVGSEKKLHQAIKTVRAFAESVVRKRRNGEVEATRKLDLLSRFMSLDNLPDNELKEIDAFYGKTSTEHRFPDVFLRDIIVSFLLAGRDTSSASLAWFFWLVSNNPHAQRNIIDEVEAVTYGEPHRLSFQNLKEMHYLHAAISEALRLYPPVAMDPRIAVNDDVWPDGSRLKKGMQGTYHAYAMGRMESIWGDDCLEFRPQRWLEDGHFVPQSPFKFPAFHAGPRVCLGKDMAMIQMKYVAAVLISKFRFRISPSYIPKYKISLTLQISGGLHAAVDCRLKHAEFEE